MGQLLRISPLLFAAVCVGCGRAPGTTSASTTQGENASTRRGPNELVEIAPIRLGRIPIGAECEAETRLINRSNETIGIREVRGGCACTQAYAEKDEAAPGETVAIKVKVSRQMKPGPVSLRMMVTTSQGLELYAPITGEVYSTLRCEPSTIQLHPDVTQQARAEARVTIVNDSPHELRVLNVQVAPSSPSFEVHRSTDAVPPSGSLEVQVSCAAAEVLEAEYHLQITTSHPDEPAIELPCVVQPVQSVRISPRVIHMGVIRPGRFSESRSVARFTVDLNSVDDWKIKDIVVPHYLTVRASPPSDGSGTTRLDLFPNPASEPPADLTSDVIVIAEHVPSGDEYPCVVPLRGFLSHPTKNE